VVEGALEHDAGAVGDGREVQHGALVPAGALGLVGHLDGGARREGLGDHGPRAAVGGVPHGEGEAVAPPGHGAHLLHERALPAAHQLDGAHALGHLEVRGVDVLDGLGGDDHPGRERRVVVLDVGRHEHAPGRVGQEVGPLLEAAVLEHVPAGEPGRVERPDGDAVDERAAGGVLLDAGVVDDERDDVELGLEGPGVRVPAVAAVDGLHREHAPLGAHRDVEALRLRAGARRAEGDGVVGAAGHGEALADGGLVAQAHGVGALRDDQEHVALLVPRLDVLDEARGLPARDGVGALHHRAVHQRRPGRALLEVAVREQPCISVAIIISDRAIIVRLTMLDY
jgi:hypothetical protein